MSTPDPQTPADPSASGATSSSARQPSADRPSDGPLERVRQGWGAAGTGDRVRVVAVAVTALAQVLGSPVGQALADRSVGDVSDAYRTLVTPAGYAFAIWGVIFAFCLAYAVYQALPGQLAREVHRRAGWPLAVAFAANTAWELAFPQDGDWLLVAQVLIVVVVAAAATALGRLQRPQPQGVDRVLPTVAASLLLGWVTIATVAQVAITGVYLGAPVTGALAQWAAIVALVAAAAVVLDVTLRLRTAAGPFAAAAAWGVLAVSEATWATPVRFAAWFALVVIGVGVLAQVWRTRRVVRTVLG